MEADKTHWKVLVNPDYIGAYALNGEDLVVTIERVTQEIVTGEGGKKEECTVAYLVGQKPLILNRTNSKTITKMYKTPYIEDWAGKQITLYPTTTKVAGDTVECLRIRPIIPKALDFSKEIEADVAKLRSCKNLSELQKAYSSVKHQADLKVIAVKDELKNNLS